VFGWLEFVSMVARFLDPPCHLIMLCSSSFLFVEELLVCLWDREKSLRELNRVNGELIEKQGQQIKELELQAANEFDMLQKLSREFDEARKAACTTREGQRRQIKINEERLKHLQQINNELQKMSQSLPQSTSSASSSSSSSASESSSSDSNDLKFVPSPTMNNRYVAHFSVSFVPLLHIIFILCNNKVQQIQFLRFVLFS